MNNSFNYDGFIWTIGFIVCVMAMFSGFTVMLVLMYHGLIRSWNKLLALAKDFLTEDAKVPAHWGE